MYYACKFIYTRVCDYVKCSTGIYAHVQVRNKHQKLQIMTVSTTSHVFMLSSQ